MTTKICTKCKQEKCETQFLIKKNSKGLPRLYSWCIECNRAIMKKLYERNPKPYKNRARAATLARQKAYYDLLKTCFCVDCGESDPVVLDFDHVEGEKVASVSKLFRAASKERIQAELAKCEVRCSNCHRKRTAQQFGWYKKFQNQ